MKKIFLTYFGLVVALICNGQESVIWASEVIDVSSQYAPYEYSALQALKRPNVLPGGGESPYAWRPKSPNKEEFIVVAFDPPIKAKQIAIAESENPGAIKKVVAYDTEYNDHVLFELTPRKLPIESRLLNLFFETAEFEIEAVKVVIDGSISEGYHSIDGIGLSSSNIPINVLIQALANVNNDLEADKLSNSVNSDFAERSPIVSPDGKRLYFSRQFHPGNVGGVDDPEDIWYSELDEETGEWLPAKNLGPPLNTKGPNFISSINVVDGEEILILGNRYGKKGRMYTGVSFSKKLGNDFSDPIPLEIENEYNYSPNSDFFMVAGGKALIISAERDDTYGSRDLYISLLNEDGTWSEPQNMGADLNSFGEEKSPFLTDDGKTLYFSSNGFSGYGGQDIYVSFKLEQDNWFKWTSPENLGAGVNKSGDDEYLSVPSSGTQLYFTRSGEGDNTDIFTFQMENLFIEDVDVNETPLAASLGHLRKENITTAVTNIQNKDVLVSVTGQVFNSKTSEAASNVKVKIERLPDGLPIGEVLTDSLGNYQFSVRAGARYAIIGELDGFISQDENFDFNDLTESRSYSRNLSLTPIEKGEKIVLNNIFFDFDESELKTSSYPELNRILGYLNSNVIKKIALNGHTDSIGDANYNIKLSGRRAKSVMDFLLRNGISQDRVSYEAFGPFAPVESNDTEEGRAKNRRVEFEIVE